MDASHEGVSRLGAATKTIRHYLDELDAMRAQTPSNPPPPLAEGVVVEVVTSPGVDRVAVVADLRASLYAGASNVGVLVLSACTALSVSRTELSAGGVWVLGGVDGEGEILSVAPRAGDGAP